MILIGDPNVLQKDQNWYDVLKHLSKLNVMIGTDFVLSARRPPSSNEAENTTTAPIPIVPPRRRSFRSVHNPTVPICPVPIPTEPTRPVPVPRRSFRSAPTSAESVSNITVPSRPVPDPIDFESFRRRLAISTTNVSNLILPHICHDFINSINNEL